jgi:hypothetical protein
LDLLSDLRHRRSDRTTLEHPRMDTRLLFFFGPWSIRGCTIVLVKPAGWETRTRRTNDGAFSLTDARGRSAAQSSSAPRRSLRSLALGRGASEEVVRSELHQVAL